MTDTGAPSYEHLDEILERNRVEGVRKRDEDLLKESKVTVMKQSDLLACPHVIIVPEHYRKDGTCKCNDPEEQARMIEEWGYTEADFEKGK